MIALIHGFGGDARSWDALDLSDALRIELLGHGRAPRTSCTWDDECDRVAALVPDGAHVVGYSLGARVALGAAVRHPQRAWRLTLIGVNPGLASADARAARAADDERWAAILDRDGLARFSAVWEDQPLFATQSPAQRATARAIRMAQDPAGLALALRTLGLARMPAYAIPPRARLVVGERDAKFRALAEAATTTITTAITAAATATNRSVTIIRGAGHNVVLEQPAAVRAAILEES